MSAPQGLRVEHLEEALGIRTTAPRLSWRLPDGAREQRAYRFSTDNGWDSGWVESDRYLLVPYAGPPLAGSQRVEWQVQVRTDLGESRWSAPAWFETGLLWPEEWQASWIEPGRMPDGAPGERQAAMLRVQFEVDRPVVGARLHATAQGLYEAYLNGERVGDAELTPGYTQYDARLQVQTFDVTASVSVGPQRPRHRARRRLVPRPGGDHPGRGPVGHPPRGPGPAAPGPRGRFASPSSGTGPGWRSAAWARAGRRPHRGGALGPDAVPAGLGRTRVRRRRLGRGGRRRARLRRPGRLPGAAGPARARSSSPGRSRNWPTGRHVVDLGQNINGWIRLTDLGPAGTTLTLTHGEWLGTGRRRHAGEPRTGPAVPARTGCRPGRSTRSCPPASPVTCSSRGGRRTASGTCASRATPASSTADDVRGVVVHTDLRRTGWFTCSDERLNRFHEAARMELPRQRLRHPDRLPAPRAAGWTGDWQLFVPTAAFLYDVAGFSTKWLRDVAADQWPDGTIANISPSPRQRGPRGPDRLPERLGRLGRRSGDRALGAVPGVRRRAGPRRAVADDGRAGSTGPSGWPASSGTRPASNGRPEPAPHERVPLGHRLPLG